jgi:hypothetical protein
MVSSQAVLQSIVRAISGQRATGYSQSLIGQQLVEFVGIAAPVTTPVVNAYTNNAVGLRP